MPFPRHVSSYRDIEAVLDTCLRHDKWPAKLSLESPGKAVQWRHRANSFRHVLRKNEEAALGIPAGQGTSIYDNLIFRLDGPQVIIDKRPTVAGQLSVGGEVVDVLSNADLESIIPAEGEDDLGIDIGDL